MGGHRLIIMHLSMYSPTTPSDLMANLCPILGYLTYLYLMKTLQCQIPYDYIVGDLIYMVGHLTRADCPICQHGMSNPHYSPTCAQVGGSGEYSDRCIFDLLLFAT